jgi:serine/threonine-protein kinase
MGMVDPSHVKVELRMARSAKNDSGDTKPRNLGRYRLYGELASGGMATVHLGRQIGSGGFSKMVAIKRLHPQFGKLDEFVDMFLAEARLAARIRHPNVVQPLDVLRVEDEVFLVMEYVEGDSLSRLMKATVARQEKVPLPVAIAVISGVLRGLHAAHEAKNDKGEPLEIVHRDVSPQNVLVGVDGTPRVIDFGIAKAADSVQVTQEGELKGKLAYIAPEILSGHRGTRRADIYAAAVVLWEVLTAQRLFDADYQSAIVANILHRPVDPPSDFLPNLPKALDEVVMKGLARDPSDRYATAREMAVALEEASPAASAAVVGEWVETVAANSLLHRGQRVAQIEAQSSEEPLEDDAEEVLSEFVTVAPSEPGPTSVKILTGSGGRPLPMAPLPNQRPTRPPPPVPPAPGPPFPMHAPPPFPSQDVALPFAATAAIPPLSTPPYAPPSITNTGGNALPAWPVAGVAPMPMSAVTAMVDRNARPRSSGSGVVVLVLGIVLAIVLLYVGFPEFLRHSYVSAAAAEGITLTIDSVEVGVRRVRLLGATATMAELPGVTAHAKSVDIGFSMRFDPTDATAHDVLLSIDGTGGAVEDSLGQAIKAHALTSLRQGTLRQFSVTGGHVVWARAFGEGTRLEAENIAFEAERTGFEALGDDFTVASPIVVVNAVWGKLGPWAASAQVDHGKAKVTLTFDPSGASKAAATIVVDQGVVTTIDAVVPRSNAGLLGIGAPVVARRPEEAFFAEGEAHYAVKTASHVEANAKISLSGYRPAGALGATDVQAELKVEGDPARPMDVTKGVFSYGPFRGSITGPVSFGDAFAKADLTFRAGGVRCPPNGEASMAITVSVDTRKLGEATAGITSSGRCALRMLPP